jgi:hypothetical protein
VPWIKGISLDERRVMERTPITTPTPSCKASSEIGTAVFVQIVKHHRLVVEPKMPADRAMERCVKNHVVGGHVSDIDLTHTRPESTLL